MLPVPPGRSSRLAWSYDCAIGEHDDTQRELGLVQLDALALPVVGERFVQPLEQRAGPLGVRPRGVVADDIVGRVIAAEAGRQLGQHLLGEFGRRERLERRVELFAALQFAAFDRPEDAVDALEQDAAVGRFDDRAAADGLLLAFQQKSDRLGEALFVLFLCGGRGFSVSLSSLDGFTGAAARTAWTATSASSNKLVRRSGAVMMNRSRRLSRSGVESGQPTPFYLARQTGCRSACEWRWFGCCGNFPSAGFWILLCGLDF